MHESDPLLWERFFAIDAVGALRQFAATLDTSVPEKAALSYYISTWTAFANPNDDAAFAPTSHLSADRSAVKYENSPVIFEGTNRWAWKPYFTNAALTQKLSDLERLVAQIRDSNPKARMILVLIPEKDHVISHYLRKETRFDAIERAVDTLSRDLVARGIPVIFTEPFVEIDRFLSLADFQYGDSHLPSRYYLTVFGFLLQALGISWSLVRDHIGLQQLPEFGDLSIKFENNQPSQVLALQPDIPGAAARQTAGTTSFADPLGETWQEFRNDQALIDQSVCILGDSHSSVFAQRKLTYLFANTFRDTHFEWNPCGIRQKPNVAAYNNVVLEVSSRFVV